MKNKDQVWVVYSGGAWHLERNGKIVSNLLKTQSMGISELVYYLPQDAPLHILKKLWDTGVLGVMEW